MPRSATSPHRRARRSPAAAAPVVHRRRASDRARPSRRETVLPDVLLAEMNRALSNRSETATVRVGGRQWKLVEAEGGACNWCESSLIIRVHGTVGPNAFATLREVIAEARARYDLLPE